MTTTEGRRHIFPFPNFGNLHLATRAPQFPPPLISYRWRWESSIQPHDGNIPRYSVNSILRKESAGDAKRTLYPVVVTEVRYALQKLNYNEYVTS